MRETLGYQETLRRGYAVVWGDGDVVTGLKAAKAAAELEIQFADGRMTVGGAAATPRIAAKRTPKKPPPAQGGGGQGSLF
jgi:exodeoxyribonuclease VII large subunit